MSVPTKRQRDLVAKMKWPPCPIETVSVSGGYIPPGQPRVTGTTLPFAEQHFDDRVILSPERHAELVRKINLAIEALEAAKDHILDLKAEQNDETPAPMFVDEAIKELKK